MRALTLSALLLCLAAAPLASPLRAEEAPKPAPAVPAPGAGDVPPGGQGSGDMGKGFDLMQEGGKLILRGLMAEMEPRMREFVRQLATLIDNLDAYEAPEMLPNGDIIIRRKVPLVPLPPGAEGNDIDL